MSAADSPRRCRSVRRPSGAPPRGEKGSIGGIRFSALLAAVAIACSAPAQDGDDAGIVGPAMQPPPEAPDVYTFTDVSDDAGYRIDWCAQWGNHCGRPAAEAFCRLRGYQRALDFVKAENIGDPRRPTRTIGDRRVCDSAHCDGFVRVTCTRRHTLSPSAGPVLFGDGLKGRQLPPMPNIPAETPIGIGSQDTVQSSIERRFSDVVDAEGYRIDYCLSWGTDCGKPAADAYCRSVGFGTAVAFIRATNIGASTPTRTFADRRICAEGECDGFASITCSAVGR